MNHVRVVHHKVSHYHSHKCSCVTCYGGTQGEERVESNVHVEYAETLWGVMLPLWTSLSFTLYYHSTYVTKALFPTCIFIQDASDDKDTFGSETHRGISLFKNPVPFDYNIYQYMYIYMHAILMFCTTQESIPFMECAVQSRNSYTVYVQIA